MSQGWLLSQIFFNNFVERITGEALDAHDGSVIIGTGLLPTSVLKITLVLNA